MNIKTKTEMGYLETANQLPRLLELCIPAAELGETSNARAVLLVGVAREKQNAA